MNYITIEPETEAEKIARLLHEFYEKNGFPPYLSVEVGGAGDVMIDVFSLAVEGE